jgi:Protein of unknown function (DUF3078)
MKIKVLFFFFLLCSVISSAQDAVVRTLFTESMRPIKKDETDTSKKSWKKGGIYSINIGQGSLSNWAAGGDDFSLSINSRLNIYAFYKKGKYSWDNSLESNLGYIKATSLGSRKNDDRIDLLSKFGYSVGEKWSLSTLLNFRSQFFKGFNYPDNVKTFISDFLAPGYILFSLGMDYKPNKDISIFLSPITSRWVIVKNDTLNAKGLYGVEPGKKSVKEIGAFASVNYLKAITKTITYKARLDLFSNYKHNPQNVDLFMTNIFSAKLSKSLSVNYSLDMIYDDDARLFGPTKKSPALQVKSILGIGFVVKF